MAVLEIEVDPGSHFRCGIQGWLQSSDEKQEWQQLITTVVQYAFVDRSATVITLSPASWSIAHSLPEPHRLRRSQDEYLINRIEICSAELLTEIAESEDFRRGLLWLSTLDSDNQEQLLRLVSETDIFSADPISNYELLLMLNDGRRIHWLKPGRDVQELAEAVRDHA